MTTTERPIPLSSFDRAALQYAAYTRLFKTEGEEMPRVVNEGVISTLEDRAEEMMRVARLLRQVEAGGFDREHLPYVHELLADEEEVSRNMLDSVRDSVPGDGLEMRHALDAVVRLRRRLQGEEGGA